MSERDEIDDPGRDPKGLDPPRNLFGGGPVQDTGGDESADPEPTESGDDDS